jgi:hypothetical protein
MSHRLLETKYRRYTTTLVMQTLLPPEEQQLAKTLEGDDRLRGFDGLGEQTNRIFRLPDMRWSVQELLHLTYAPGIQRTGRTILFGSLQTPHYFRGESSPLRPLTFRRA